MFELKLQISADLLVWGGREGFVRLQKDLLVSFSLLRLVLHDPPWAGKTS